MPDRKIPLLIALLVAFMLTAPVFAEQLDPIWQEPRDYFNKLSDRACEGDQEAYAELFESAVTRSNPVAMNDLGWLKETQHCSFSNENLFSAALAYKGSAQAGYPIGQNNYAKYLMEGEVIDRDLVLAKEYFNRAMDAGYGEAAVRLGLYYLSAEFLPIDDTVARSLYDRAVKEGADPDRLADLAAELKKIDAMSNPEPSEIDERQQLFTDSWGLGYGEARWDYAPNGKFESRVFVGVYDDTKHFYLGMMRDTYDPVVSLTGITVEYADETLFDLDLSFCQNDTCRVNQYGDNFGYPGSFITVTLPPSKQREILEAIKSANYVIFHYLTESGIKQNTLSLKGSRKAIDALAQANGLSSVSVKNAATSQLDDGAYRTAVNFLHDELNLNWAEGARQWFISTETTCVFQTLVHHPNTGKTTSEFDLGSLDPDQIDWPDDILGGKTHFLRVATLDHRKAAKLWISYPDGTSEYKDETEISLYIGEHGNFDGIKPQLATAIRHCNKIAQQ